MEISRSEKKRQAARIEKLADELVALSANEIKALPAPPELCAALRAAHGMKGGALRRQVKFIAGELRGMDHAPLADFLAARKGSHLRQRESFHELENLRQGIISEVLQALDEARAQGEGLPGDWPSPTLTEAARVFPGLDPAAVRTAAQRYARTRKIIHSREIFRLLKAGQTALAG